MASTEVPSRYIPTSIYPRMLGYSVSLAVHVINAIHMINIFQGDVLKDPDVRRFYDDGYKFLTVWNVFMQMFYSSLGLSCDVLSLINEGKHTSLLKTLKKVRNPVFSSIIFPFSFTIPSIFWTVYLYERSLMLPPSVDKTLSGTANHIIHTAIVPFVLWEIVFRPRTAPKSHVPNLVLMYSYTTAYLIVLVTSYIVLGTWVYPILNLLDGTVYLYLFLGTAVILVQIFYCLQWYLTDLIWDNREEMKKVN